MVMIMIWNGYFGYNTETISIVGRHAHYQTRLVSGKHSFVSVPFYPVGHKPPYLVNMVLNLPLAH